MGTHLIVNNHNSMLGEHMLARKGFWCGSVKEGGCARLGKGAGTSGGAHIALSLFLRINMAEKGAGLGSID